MLLSIDVLRPVVNTKFLLRLSDIIFFRYVIKLCVIMWQIQHNTIALACCNVNCCINAVLQMLSLLQQNCSTSAKHQKLMWFIY